MQRYLKSIHLVIPFLQSLNIHKYMWYNFKVFNVHMNAWSEEKWSCGVRTYYSKPGPHRDRSSELED